MFGSDKAKKQAKAAAKTAVYPSIMRIDRADFPILNFGVSRMRIGNVDSDIVPGMYVHAVLPLPFHSGEEEHISILGLVYGIQDGVAAMKIEELSPISRRLIQDWVIEATEKGALAPKPLGAPPETAEPDAEKGEE